jgi:hypothetical protein
MLHHQEPVLAQRIGEFPGRARPRTQHIQNAPPVRIGESPPNIVEIIM